MAPKNTKLIKALQVGMKPDDKWISYEDVRLLTTCGEYSMQHIGYVYIQETHKLKM